MKAVRAGMEQGGMTVRVDAIVSLLEVVIMKTGLREDKKRGLAVVLRGEGISPLCLVSAVYDPSIQCWKPDYPYGHHLSDFRSWPRKKEAVQCAKDLCWPTNKVTCLGTRFSRGWGLRWDLRYPYFLAVDWDDEKVDSVICAHMTEQEMYLRDFVEG